MKVAIVGAGPRGTAALGALANCVTRPITVHLFGALDDDGNLIAGHGTPFSPDQPHFSRLNARSAIVDQFGDFRPEPVAPDAANPSGEPAGERDNADARSTAARVGDNFDAWAADNAPEWVDSFPPRAVVGQYMSHAYRQIRDSLPEHIELHEHGRASKVSGEPGRWRITTGMQTFVADELLLAVGHAERGPNELAVSEHAELVIPHAYPVSVLDQISAQATVAVRGAGLTFIDVALALTEGRGGSFSDDGTQYTGVANQPATIYPLGLEGIFLDVKPDLDQIEALIPAGTLSDARARISRARKLSTIMDTIRSLTESIYEKEGMANPHTVFDAVVAGPQPSAGNARATLAESLAAFTADRSLTARAIFAGVILKLYGQIVNRVSGREWDGEDWATFSSWMALASSYGFGPPPANARKILTLIDAGIIDCSWLDDGVDARDLPQRVDAMVDAVLAPSGYWPEAYPALTELAPYLDTWADPTDPTKRSGVRTNDNAYVVDANLEPIAGLAAVGRMTDDWIIGLDSLNAALHPHITNWARAIDAAE